MSGVIVFRWLWNRSVGSYEALMSLGLLSVLFREIKVVVASDGLGIIKDV